MAASVEGGGGDDHLAGEDHDGEPDRNRAVDDDGADADDEQHAVGHRIEHLADGRDLVEVPGDVAVEEVGGAEHAEQDGRGDAVLPAEQQPQEHRQARQPDDGDDVGNREDAVVHRLDGDGGLRHAESIAPLGLAASSARPSATDERLPWLLRLAAPQRRLSKNPPMATLFTRIIEGELPGRFVWRDERCVAFLTINPLKPGHTLVVPIEEFDHWIDCPPDLLAHLIEVARIIAQALQAAYEPEKVALIAEGLEVNHVHLHVSPIWRPGDTEFARAEQNPEPAALDEAQAIILRHLAELGHADPVGAAS